MNDYLIRQCKNELCRFRFPAAVTDVKGNYCPRCKTETTAVSIPTYPAITDSHVPTRLPQLEVMLDNIRSIFNVGAMIRTADGAGVRHLHLCGITAPPTHPKIAKTALGAESILPWSYANNGVDTAVSLKQQGYQLWALEATPTAEPLFTAPNLTETHPILFIAGNEKVGVDPAILNLCDRLFCLPMQGYKESLNVAVAFGIALYHLQFSTS